MNEQPVTDKVQTHPFNYQYQRFMIGFVALCLPLFVMIFGCNDLLSLSFSYHSYARDIFVGCLMAVGALMIPYQGRDGSNRWEFWLAKFGGVSAILVGLIPMDCYPEIGGGWKQPFECFVAYACDEGTNGKVHLWASIGVFVSLFILCLIFRRNALGKKTLTGNIRAKIYVVCMAGIASGAVLAGFYRLGFELLGVRTVFWAESIMLFAFSIAWLTASKMIIREKLGTN